MGRASEKATKVHCTAGKLQSNENTSIIKISEEFQSITSIQLVSNFWLGQKVLVKKKKKNNKKKNLLIMLF